MNKKTLYLSGGIIACILVLCACGVFSRTDTPRTISVTGECLTTAPKDKTAITLRVTTLDKSATTSMKMANQKIKEITNFLKNQDVKVQTTEFNSYEKTEWNRALEKSVKLGIETTISIEISADDIETIEKILSQFAGMENVYTENLRMYTSNKTMKPIMEKCLGAAVQDARTRANALAAGDNRHAGRMLSVSYGINTDQMYQPRATNFMLAKSAVAMDSVEAGGTLMAKDTEVSVTVSAVFEIR